ncbi:carbohydrate-binding module family 1 protein [Mycena filopes]|nr:carbohydrate-binding module family 1 protein [Mycena filopes]
MKSAYLSALAAFFAYVSAQTTAPQWGQCGGMGWTGPTTCPAGWGCVVSSQWYSQCLQGAATTTTVTTSTTGTGTGTGTSTASSTTTAPGGSSTLAPGYSFIRAVEDPNFHKYLQSQFQVVNGQLIQNAGGKNLYAIVAPPANSTVTKLGVSWSTTPDTLGTFVFSGDSLEWSSPTVKRQQNNAWLVCPTGSILSVFINLGAYAFMTPAGCADETLNAYTGATAVP